MSYAIATHELCKDFGRIQAVQNLTFQVPVGSIYGFLGPNGSGKTTTLRILAGLSRPTQGTAEIMGVPVTPAGRHRRHIGFLSQEPKFYGWMTGREVMRYVARFFGTPDEAHITELLGEAGISKAADRKTKTYSGGMRQRLGIAQAMVGRPEVLMLDEPVSSLDPVGRAEVLDMMSSLKGKTTIFYSTHILEDVQRSSDYVAILDQGKLITSDKTSDLLAKHSKGRLSVVLAGQADEVAGLKTLPGVAEATSSGRVGDKWSYELLATDGQMRTVQRAVTKYAGERGLAVLECDEASLNLESVFLKLVGSERKSRRRPRDDDDDRDRRRR